MKKILLLTFVFSFTLVKGQICNPTNVPTDIYYPNSTITPTNVSGYEYLCGPSTIVYDTIAMGCHFIYVNSGCHLIFKYGECAGPSDVWIKNGGTLTIVSTSVALVLFYEPSAVINNTIGASITSYSCTSITFPTVNCSPTGINEVRLGKEGLNIYPNPTTGKIFIEIEELNKISISDYLGQSLYKLIDPSPKQEIDLSSFANGIYFLKTESKEGQKVFKIIKE